MSYTSIESQAHKMEIEHLGIKCFNAWARAGFGLANSKFEGDENTEVRTGLDWDKILRLFKAAGTGRVVIRMAGEECIEKVRLMAESREKERKSQNPTS